MYGESAAKLIRQITQEDGDIIPTYQYELVEQVMRENDILYAENLRTSQTIPAAASTSDQADQADPVARIGGDQNIEPMAGPSRIDEDKRAETPPTNGHETNGHRSEEVKGKTALDNMDIGEKELMVMQVRHTAKLWNKRCIIAYHYERLNRLKKLRWEYGNNLPTEIVEKLSKEELEWFTKYNDNLFSYMSALNDGKGLDLTLYATPPKKLYVQVKCIRDYGQFDLEDGQPVMLKKDSIHYLPLSQCEKLIHQGVLEQTSL